MICEVVEDKIAFASTITVGREIVTLSITRCKVVNTAVVSIISAVIIPPVKLTVPMLLVLLVNE